MTGVQVHDLHHAPLPAVLRPQFPAIARSFHLSKGFYKSYCLLLTLLTPSRPRPRSPAQGTTSCWLQLVLQVPQVFQRLQVLHVLQVLQVLHAVPEGVQQARGAVGAVVQGVVQHHDRRLPGAAGGHGLQQGGAGASTRCHQEDGGGPLQMV